jgi:hypothetical protein
VPKTRFALHLAGLLAAIHLTGSFGGSLAKADPGVPTTQPDSQQQLKDEVREL